MKNAFLVLALALTGCVNTGINVGGVFIPVNTGIGETKKTEKEAPAEAPSPQSAPQQEQEAQAETDEAEDLAPSY